MTSFVPRPIYRVKPYVYLGEAGDTAATVTRKFGRPAGDYRELVAANLENRRLMPMPLGSPFGARTFVSITPGESLKIPAHWPDPVGTVSGGSDPTSVQVPDAILQGIGASVAAANAASGGSAVPAGTLPAVTNAAVQWWTNTQGTKPAATPMEYAPYVANAIAWVNTYGAPIAQKASPQTLIAFPWGPFLAMLPAQVDPSKVDWSNGSLPGTNGTPWSAIPWGYLAEVGPALETIKPPVIAWPQSGDPVDVLMAFKAAIDAALAAAGQQGQPTGGQQPGGQQTQPTGGQTTPTGGQTQPTGGTTTTGTQTQPTTTTPSTQTQAVTTEAPKKTNRLLVGALVVGGVALIAGAAALGKTHSEDTKKGGAR